MLVIGCFLLFGYTGANHKFNDIQRRIYYDSMLDPDTLIFLIEINQLSEKETKELIKDVIMPMRRLLAEIYVGKKEGTKLIEGKADKYGWKNNDEHSEEFTRKVELDSEEINTIKKNFNKKSEEKKKTKEKHAKDSESPEETLLELLRTTSSFSVNVKTKHSSIDKSLEKRNKIFESDMSQIAKGLFKASQDMLIEDIEEFVREGKEDHENPRKEKLNNLLNIKDLERKDGKYFQMVENLERTITESDNIVKIKQREENEFTLTFQPQTKAEEIKRLKMAFNLGSTFLTPGIYITISKMLLIPEKSLFIEKVTNQMLKPVLTLTNFNSTGADTEKKENIVNFLKDVVSRVPSKFTEEIDGAFKARSTILDKFLQEDKEEMRDKKIEQIDTVLEIRNKELLAKIEGIRAEHFKDFLILNQEIINAYIRFVNTNNKNDKVRLVEYFEK